MGQLGGGGKSWSHNLNQILEREKKWSNKLASALLCRTTGAEERAEGDLSVPAKLGG